MIVDHWIVWYRQTNNGRLGLRCKCVKDEGLRVEDRNLKVKTCRWRTQKGGGGDVGSMLKG